MTEPKTTEAPDDAARHAQKMAKKKAARDKIMATKEGEKGLIIVHTGAGKGKSSSAFGMILRCIAHEMPCAVVQFIKGAWSTGERTLIEANFAHEGAADPLHGERGAWRRAGADDQPLERCGG